MVRCHEQPPGLGGPTKSALWSAFFIPIPGRQPNALVVHGSVPFKTFKESIGCGKKNSGTRRYDSGGVGSRGSSMWRCSRCPRGVFITHIPYRGNIQAVPFFKPDWPLGLMQKAPAAIKNEVVNRPEDAMGKWRP
jgi:hypothetical protein